MKPIFRALSLAAALSAFTATTAGAETFVRVGGGLAGTYPIFAAKLAELINKNIKGVTANVVSGNVEKSQIGIETGELDLNLAPSFDVKKIYDGKGSLGVATKKVRHIITLYGSSIQPIARKGGVTSIGALDDKANRVWTGQKSGFFAQIYGPMMEAAGTSMKAIRSAGGVIEEYGYLDQVQGFQDGKLDAGIFAGPIPYGLLLQIEKSPGFQLIPMTGAELDRLEKILPGIGRRAIPAGSYKGQTADVLAPYYVNQLVANVNANPDLIYKVTKLMYEKYKAFHGIFPGSQEIDDKDVLKYNRIPVHPAAEKYFKEVGAM